MDGKEIEIKGEVVDRGDEIAIEVYHFLRDHYEFFIGLFVGMIAGVWLG